MSTDQTNWKNVFTAIAVSSFLIFLFPLGLSFLCWCDLVTNCEFEMNFRIVAISIGYGTFSLGIRLLFFTTNGFKSQEGKYKVPVLVGLLTLCLFNFMFILSVSTLEFVPKEELDIIRNNILSGISFVLSLLTAVVLAGLAD